MTQNIDDKIIDLKRTIQQEKEQLEKDSKFVPLTNCSLRLPSHSNTFNLHAIDLQTAVYLLAELTSFGLTAKNVGLENLELCGYPVNDWRTDLQNKIKQLRTRERRQKLAQNEARLTQLLSNEKKAELEFFEILRDMTGDN